MPSPTVWPLVFAAGVALVFTGVVSSAIVKHARRSFDAVRRDWLVVRRASRGTPRVAARRSRTRKGTRYWPPRRYNICGSGVSVTACSCLSKSSRILAGLKGGVVGAVAMAGVAMLCGLLSQGSIWYPVNLPAAAALPDMATAERRAVASIQRARTDPGGDYIHGLTSLMVGVLYAVMLPMFPKAAFWWAGVSSPILWSGLIASTLALVNPALNARIDWRWCVASQLAFGLTGGFVIAKSQSIDVLQHLPLAVRAGIDAPGVSGHDGAEAMARTAPPRRFVETPWRKRSFHPGVLTCGC